MHCDDPEEDAKCLDDDGDLICNVDEVLGCTNPSACNYNGSATDDDDSCQLNLFCYDSDGDGFGYGDSTQICLNEIPRGWVLDCSDVEDDCNGVRDDCGECNGNNQSKDCMDICFGTSVLDGLSNCCEISKFQNFNTHSTCLVSDFRWALRMTVTMGEYSENVFTLGTDSISNYFILGTHYFSTDSLDISDDIDYSDIVQPPSTVQNSIYLYTSHPDWNYQFGDNFIREYKEHNIEKVSSEEGISWEGLMMADYYGPRHIKVAFELESHQDRNVESEIEFNFNNIVPDFQTTCSQGLYFSNNNNEPSIMADSCNVIGQGFEYIAPMVFQGSGYTIPFNISVKNTFISNERIIPPQDK